MAMFPINSRWTALAGALAVTACIGMAAQRSAAQLPPEPADGALSLPGTDAVASPFGDADGGVRIRARALKKVWKAGEKPEIYVDLTTGKGGLKLRRFPYCEVEVDGVWYVPLIRGLVAGAEVLPQASRREDVAAVRLERKLWLLKTDSNRRLELKPGKHTVRVSCEVDVFHPVSGPVEIEITPAE